MTGSRRHRGSDHRWWRRLRGDRRREERRPETPAAPDLVEENARLRRAVAELSVINDVAREIAGSLDSQVIVDRIIHRARKVVDAEQAAVVLVAAEGDGDPKTLVRSITLRGGDQVWHLDQKLLGWMSVHRQPLLSNEPGRDERLEFARIPGSVRDLVCVPMQVGGVLIGVLVVVNRRGGEGFTGADARLLGIIASQSAQVVEAARLYEHEQALADVQQELRAARRIQRHLVPETLPRIPGYDLAAAFHTAGEVGGDCYDCLPCDSGRWTLCLFDVSGKGVPAALLAANLQAAFRARLAAGEGPAVWLTRLNEHLIASAEHGDFASCFLGTIDPATHRFVYSAAGHEPALLVRRTGPSAAAVERLATGNLLLGLRGDHAYRDGAADLDPGDVVVIHTDGITDVFDGAGERFGHERLATAIREASRGTAAQIAAAILSAARDHGAATSHPDDQAILILKREEPA